ncbi:carboxy terminal-processing peptidase [Myxococcota bacterium]|nr:carboxy terminal-processing peptidase [Myxococcota bacterium]
MLRPCLTLILGLWLLAPAPAAATLRCEMLPNFLRNFLHNHVEYRELTPELEHRTIETHLRQLDPSRNLLTQAEADALQENLKGVFAEVLAGNCTRLLVLHQEIVDRNGAMVEKIEAVVSSDDYAVDSTVEIILDPDKRGYPADAAARQKVLESLIHFQVSNYLSSDSSLTEARERLIRRYTRRHNRLEDRDDEDVYALFLDAFALSLDPHSNYLSSDTWEDFKIQMTLSLEGIGVGLSERDGYAVAEHIIPGGAAERQKGLKPKDKIIAVAQEGGEPVDIIDMPLREAVSLIRGDPGTKVTLTVLRQGEKTERLKITIVRDKINLDEQAASVRYEEFGEGEEKIVIAVLELPSFYGDSDPNERKSSRDVAKLLKEIKETDTDGLVLDLSRNGGGLLDEAVTISGFFLRRGEIVRVETGRGHKQPYIDADDQILYSGPLVVHTSRLSASASEILAGALKDYRRAIIAGSDHTFGKGTVQSVQALPPGQGAFKVTTAMFYRPGGQSTQNSGVAADVVIPSTLSNDDFGEKAQRFPLPSQRVVPFLSTTSNTDDPAQSWQAITDEVVATLATRSQLRVSEDEEFDEIREKIEEQDASGGVVKLADILKEQEEADPESSSEQEPPAAEASTGDGDVDDDGESADPVETAEASEEEEEEEEPTPELREAIRILADLISLTQNAPVISQTP